MITKLAIEAYSKLHEYTKTLCLEIDNTSSIECSHVSDLSLCNSNIHTHLFLNNIRCEVVNIYQELIYSFRGNRARQKVSFYTKESFHGESTLITDSRILNELFSVPNCLPLFKIIPMQIASNAKKYMLDSGELSVTLIKKDRDIHIMFSNFGPYCSAEDLEHIFEEGFRGKQSDIAVGLGVGLYEIRKIVDLHSWLNMDCYVSSNEENYTTINNYKYSEFCIELVYSPIIEDVKLPAMEDINNMVQITLIHNSYDIADKIIRISNNMRNIKRYREESYKLNTEANLFLDSIKFCHFLYNNKYDVSCLLGNPCRMDISNVFKASIMNLKKIYFPKLGELDIEGNLSPIDTYSCMYSVIMGFLYLVLSCYNSGDNILVTYEDDTITIERFECNIQSKLINMIDKDKLEMYEKLFDELKYNIQYKHNSIKIILS